MIIKKINKWNYVSQMENLLFFANLIDEMTFNYTLDSFKASVHNISPAIQFTFVQNTDNHVQISLGGWTADYPSASTFLMTLFSCESFHPHSDNSPNMSGFCSPTIDRMMNNALSQTLNNRAESNRLWAKVDRALMQQAPAVPLVQTQNVILLSKRVHNVIITLNNELLFSQLQIQ